MARPQKQGRHKLAGVAARSTKSPIAYLSAKPHNPDRAAHEGWLESPAPISNNVALRPRIGDEGTLARRCLATLAFSPLTISCVNCHQNLRASQGE
jgi:hypothetical protein